MSEIRSPAPKPCESCPYRQDVPSGVWSADEYLKLPEYDEETWAQPVAVFQCHQTDRESDKARLCAGWVACHGPENLLALRIGVATGKLDVDVLDYTTDVPLMFSGADACEHGMADIDAPGEEAQALVAKISASRADIGFA